MLIRAAGLPLRWLHELAAFQSVESESEMKIAAEVRRAFDAALLSLEESPLRTAVYKARRDFFQKNKTPANAFFEQLHGHRGASGIDQLMDGLDRWKSTLAASEENRKAYSQALAANHQLLRQAARNETLCRALLFASHDLLERLPSFAEKPVENFNKKDRQAALSLLQYLSRSVVKTTPLSRFTTVGMQRLGQVNEPGNDFFSASKPVITPNVALLPAIYEVLLQEPAFYRALSVALNPCITGRSEEARTDGTRQTWIYFDGENESFQQMGSNPVAEVVIKTLLGQQGNMPFSRLLEALENLVEATAEQLQSLVFELIEYGLLEWVLPEKGLSPGWCGGLYQFLGFLPQQPPMIVDAAALLQWLRTAARTLPYQTIEATLDMQRETVRTVQDFFEKYGNPAPPISPEHIFFEDVAETLEAHVPEAALQSLTKDLAECWRNRNAQSFSPLRSRLYAFARKNLPDGRSIDFQEFCRTFLAQNPETQATPVANRKTTDRVHKIGVLFQVFRDETGRYRAVVNGLFPGGGKMFARWLHLFPTTVTESLKEWLSTERNGAIPFPWQGWSNANFQPVISSRQLSVPFGRTACLKAGQQIYLGNLAIQFDTGGFHLIDGETNEPVLLTDLGLEAPESRPPAMQILWHLGVPYVSIEALLPSRKWIQGGADWHLMERTTSGDLILSRQSWRIGLSILQQWLTVKSDVDFFVRVRAEMAEMKIPRQFFAHFVGEKPQYFDLNSPLLMQLFAKLLKQGKHPLLLTEMMPLPEHCVVEKDGLHAAEFVLEFEV